MKDILIWCAALALTAAAFDRALLWMESRGWLNYRRNGLSRGAALYHTFEIQRIFDPGIQQVIEARYEERKKQDDPGAPPAPR